MRANKRCTRYLDTETTGFQGSELVEIALLNSHGRPLIDTLIRPTRAKRWDDAQRIHGISPAMVKDAPTLEDVLPEVIRHLRGHHLVVYNLSFDISFFPTEVRSAPAKMSCAMEQFAEAYGDWNDYHGSYRWQKLHVAAAHVRHTWEGTAHRARADAHACRSVWRWLREQRKAQRAGSDELAQLPGPQP